MKILQLNSHFEKFAITRNVMVILRIMAGHGKKNFYFLKKNEFFFKTFTHGMMFILQSILKEYLMTSVQINCYISMKGKSDTEFIYNNWTWQE